MKYFISYAWTGEDQKVVTQRMATVRDLLNKHNVAHYINLFDERTKSFTHPGEFVQDAMDRIKECDAMIVVKSSARKSEGQLMEIGAALYEKNPVSLLLHESAADQTYIDDSLISDMVVSWNESNLKESLLALLDELSNSNSV